MKKLLPFCKEEDFLFLINIFSLYFFCPAVIDRLRYIVRCTLGKLACARPCLSPSDEAS